jgi:hypothetical protein
MLQEFGVHVPSIPADLQDFLQSDAHFALVVAPLSQGFALH